MLTLPNETTWNPTPDTLTAPLTWGEARVILVTTDLFNGTPYLKSEWIDCVFATMTACHQHTFLLVTSDTARAKEYLADESARALGIIAALEPLIGRGRPWQGEDRVGWMRADESFLPLSNVQLYARVTTQAEADERLPKLLECPAAVRGVYAVPREAIDLLIDGECSAWACCECGSRNVDTEVQVGPDDVSTYRCRDCKYFGGGEDADWTSLINVVRVSGETGPDAKPTHPQWVRSLRDQANAAGVDFLFVSWGDFIPIGEAYPQHARFPAHDVWFGEENAPDDLSVLTYRVGASRSGRELDGVTHDGLTTAEVES